MKKFIQILKEELIIIPVLIVGLLYLKNFLSINFPNSAQYDMPSEVETIIFGFLKLIVLTSMSWLAYSIVFPKIFRHFRDRFYLNFETAESQAKNKISFIIYIALFAALVLLTTSCHAAEAKETAFRQAFCDNLHTQLNVRESTGKNDGKEVEKYLKSVGLGKGYAWCAAYCSYNLQLFRVPAPKSAWSPDFAQQKDIIWRPVSLHKGKPAPQSGDCFTLYYSNIKRVGHVGFIVGETAGYFITIEGNTNNAGSREGDGVYKKKRDKQKVYAVTNYISKFLNNEKITNNRNNNAITAKLQGDKNNKSKQHNTERQRSYKYHASDKGYNLYNIWRYLAGSFTHSRHDNIAEKRQYKPANNHAGGQIASGLLDGRFGYKTEFGGLHYTELGKAIVPISRVSREGSAGAVRTPNSQNIGVDGFNILAFATYLSNYQTQILTP
jgi:hypothetical protein